MTLIHIKAGPFDFEARLEEIREYWRLSGLAPLSP